MRIFLTDRFVASTKADTRTDYFDTKVAGLALRVSPTGKTWTMHYTSPTDGKRARLTLGGYPALSLANARRLALEARQATHAGEDPRATSGKQASVAAVVEGYLEKHVRVNCRSPRQIEQRLRNHVIPLIGSMRIDALHRRDINRLVDAALKRGSPIAANRLFEDLRAAFRWAVARGDLDRNPIEGMKRPTEPRIRERQLSEAEIRHLWHVLPTVLADYPEAYIIIRLCLVTAQRVGEVSGMRRSELDLNARLWTLPGARTKNGHAHTVPLTAAALQLIPDGERDEVFETSPIAVSRIINRNQLKFGIASFCAHDLRRSAISQMAELGVSPIVLGHVANHRSTTKADVTLAVYSRYTYEREKREALNLWAERLDAIVNIGPAHILPMTARHA